MNTGPAAPLTWKTHGRGLIACLGVWEVGEVNPWMYFGGVPGAWWRVNLPGLMGPPRRASDLAAGQAAVERLVLGWIDAAELSPASARELALRSWRCAAAAPPAGVASS